MDIRLGPEPGRDEIFDVCRRAKEALPSGQPLRLVTEDVQRVSPALAQLIIGISRAAGPDAPFTLVSPSAPLVDAFQAYGLFADFMTIPME
ncbi:STAS domain-containing protein [Alsobacter sp. SYSU M60028]|uniref:STAS domain-containing protein n=1 Tax=Alsobacter ponti TaxID=2962936 RepID=A0ABT1LA28_9HYPH|nr:STAS domain-containing protein [Alsobacter ponti]MCP8937821.1 STAS domain-containing protein [Alsobacter ponti]